MTVDTKFELGQTVYFMGTGFQIDTIQSIIVERHIESKILESKGYWERIKYQLEGSGIKDENDLCATLEELVDAAIGRLDRIEKMYRRHKQLLAEAEEKDYSI